MNLQAVGWGVDVIDNTQVRDRWRAYANSVINIRIL
jgi:hypothetical protein